MCVSGGGGVLGARGDGRGLGSVLQTNKQASKLEA